MVERSEDTQREQLSALADGELDVSATTHACTDWRNDPSARAAWHVYHVIGDVLRSDELACDARGDVDFLRKLQKRMAEEPVVLAPASSSTGKRRSWMVSLGIAAGFMAVVSTWVLVVQGPSVPRTMAADSMARAAAPSAPPAVAEPELEALADPADQSANGKLLRDARLDFYLAAHKQFGGTSALDVPAGFLRSSANTQAPSRWEVSGAPP